MSVFAQAVLASEATHAITELPMPAPMYGVVVLGILVVLGLVTFSFRDVANRHAEKAEAYAREHGTEEH